MNDNGYLPAYPLPREISETLPNVGLTKREYFAGIALQGLLLHTLQPGLRANEDYAKKAIELSDELLKQLEQ